MDVGKTSILIVEDESIVAMDIKNMLIGLGYKPLGIATTGDEAIKLVEKNKPDLVLMDIMLKGKMDGIQAAEIIRSRYNIPVVYLTAYSDEATLKRAKITEPFGYILKPFEERELRTNIEIALYRHRMETRLKESRKWFSTTLRSIGDAVIATDTDGRITYMNPVAEKLTGWSEDEASGRSIEEIFSIRLENSDKKAENPLIQSLEKGEVVTAGDMLLITKDGREVPIDDSAAPIIDDMGNKMGGVLIFKDVTERREAERRIRRRLKFEKTLSDISSKFVGIFDMDGSINYSLEKLGRLIGASAASFLVFREGETTLECNHAWSENKANKEKLRNLKIKNCRLLADKLDSDRVVQIEDISSLSEELHDLKDFERLGIKSLIGLSVYIGAKAKGLICFFDVLQNKKWTDEDLMLLKVFSGILGSSLERKQAEDELKRSLESLQKSMKGTIYAIAKIYENNTQRPSRFGRSPGI